MKNQIETIIRKAILKAIGTYNIPIDEVVVMEAGADVMDLVKQNSINETIFEACDSKTLAELFKPPTAQTPVTPTFGDITPQTQTSK